uniref:Uncharacterized protein n=1 Tax=Knipowitschia caucasica TaxID=637954 RepID=A0AAV2L8I9_KNICA
MSLQTLVPPSRLDMWKPRCLSQLQEAHSEAKRISAQAKPAYQPAAEALHGPIHLNQSCYLALGDLQLQPLLCPPPSDCISEPLQMLPLLPQLLP